jgi:hypothetical protein
MKQPETVQSQESAEKQQNQIYLIMSNLIERQFTKKPGFFFLTQFDLICSAKIDTNSRHRANFCRTRISIKTN